MPTPRVPSRRGVAAVVALTTLAACGPAEPQHPALRISEEAPLPAAGSDERPPPSSEEAPSAAVAPGGLATFVASLPGRAVVAARPGLADPARQRRSSDAAPATPKLTGRTVDGKQVVEFPLAHTRVVASDTAGNVSRRRVPLRILAAPSGRERAVAYASAGGAAVFAAVVLVALVAAVLLRRRRKPRPLERVLLAGSIRNARDP